MTAGTGTATGTGTGTERGKSLSGGTTRRGAVTTAGAFLARGAVGTTALLAAACGNQEADRAGSGARIAEAVTIDYMHRWDGVREPLVADQVKAFASVQPNVKVNSLNVFCSGADCPQGMPYPKIVAQIAAGTPPDVMMIDSGNAADLQSRGALRNLVDLARRDKVDLGKTFYPSAIQMATIKGAVTGLPQIWPNQWPYLFYSNEAWESAGLDPKKPPTSWEELVSYSQKLTKPGEGPGGLDRIGLDFPGRNFEDWAALNNTKLLSDDATKVLFNTREGQDTLEWMQRSMQTIFGTWDRRQAFLTGVRGTGPAAARVPRYTNKLGMWVDGVWAFFVVGSEAREFNPQFNYSVALVPHNAKNPQAQPRSVGDLVWLASMGSGGKREAAAWEWLKYITMEEGNRILTAGQQQPSGVPKINEDPAFSKGNPHWNTVVKRALGLMTPLPQTPAWPRVRTILTDMTNQVMTGGKGPREALDTAAREAQLVLDEVKR